MSPAPIAIVILAAGGSNRLGRPKQLIPFRGSTLVAHAAGEAFAAALGPVILVTGADADRVAAALGGADVLLVPNRDWEAGMGTSIGRGIAAAASLRPEASGAILMTCDQPAVTAAHLAALAARFRQGADPVGSAYGGGVGTPVLFGRAWFEDLADLPPGAGARGLLDGLGQQPDSVPLPRGEFDVDEPADLEALRQWL